MEIDIVYKDYRKKSDIHGTVLYPAPMIAPMQKDIIKNLISKNNISTVFDPFFGSGTALYEASEVDKDLELYGCDINPLAYLITKTKLQGINESIYYHNATVEVTIDETYPDGFYFEKMEKWYRDDIADSLRRIRKAIIQIDDPQNRAFYWCLFSNIVRKYSNSRSATYKLHIRTDEQIERMPDNAINDFLCSITLDLDKFKKGSSNFTLYKADILTKIAEFEDRSFDLSITSPPYGDNQTTVPYGQFSSLALNWIPDEDLQLDGWEKNNYSIIDSHSLGGANSTSNICDEDMELLQPYLENISLEKQKKVIRFFSDYFRFLSQLCRVTNKYIVLTLGNRTVDGVTIDLSKISFQYLENHSFKNIDQLTREIPFKRIPKTTSIVNNSSVQSMNSEYVLIHERTQN